MPPSVSGPLTTGSSMFSPDDLFDQWANREKPLPENNDLRSSIIRTFQLPRDDGYVYHAIASVNLSQVQSAIEHGSEAGFHAWYKDKEGKVLEPPPRADIEAYTKLFSPKTTPLKALSAFAANARKDSIRGSCASYLQSKRLLPSSVTIPRSKNYVNLAYDFWCWSCECLEWCGPTPESEKVNMSHHILPVFMHHFGCVVPSFEALQIMKQICKGREILDMGSGNGYWTYMLRRLGLQVCAIDNLQSSWRTVWIGDTIPEDGAKYLQANRGCQGSVLLLVYPVVGGNFTKTIIDLYKGDTIIVAGTQNRSGYTAFRDATIDDWMAAEEKDYEKVVHIPLPSFPGKDEALFVFERNNKQ